MPRIRCDVQIITSEDDRIFGGFQTKDVLSRFDRF